MHEWRKATILEGPLFHQIRPCFREDQRSVQSIMLDVLINILKKVSNPSLSLIKTDSCSNSYQHCFLNGSPANRFCWKWDIEMICLVTKLCATAKLFAVITKSGLKIWIWAETVWPLLKSEKKTVNFMLWQPSRFSISTLECWTRGYPGYMFRMKLLNSQVFLYSSNIPVLSYFTCWIDNYCFKILNMFIVKTSVLALFHSKYGP